MANDATYDFIMNDEDEAMLLLYAGDTKPENAKVIIDFEKKSAELHRNPTETIVLDSVPDDVLDSLSEADTLLVCEIANTDKDDDNRIVYAYEAEIVD